MGGLPGLQGIMEDGPSFKCSVESETKETSELHRPPRHVTSHVTHSMEQNQSSEDELAEDFDDVIFFWYVTDYIYNLFGNLRI
jgi:hypothetical protein